MGRPPRMPGSLFPALLPAQVWLLLSMATNGACFFITAGLVTAQRNFPQSGGIVAGIVVGFIGLSGAIFAQLYDTFLAPNTAGFLWMLAVLPALVALASCFIVKPYPPRECASCCAVPPWCSAALSATLGAWANPQCHSMPALHAHLRCAPYLVAHL